MNQAPDVGGKLDIAHPGLRPTPWPSAILALDEVRSGNAKRGSDGLHWEASGAGERDSKVGFLAPARSTPP
jgi:hypothetical protein